MSLMWPGVEGDMAQCLPSCFEGGYGAFAEERMWASKLL